MEKILEKARELGKLIADSEIYINSKEKEALFLQDEEASTLMYEYTKTQENGLLGQILSLLNLLKSALMKTFFNFDKSKRNLKHKKSPKATTTALISSICDSY